MKKDHLSQKRRGRFLYILKLIWGLIREKRKRGVLTWEGKIVVWYTFRSSAEPLWVGGGYCLAIPSVHVNLWFLQKENWSVNERRISSEERKGDIEQLPSSSKPGKLKMFPLTSQDSSLPLSRAQHCLRGMRDGLQLPDGSGHQLALLVGSWCAWHRLTLPPQPFLVKLVAAGATSAPQVTLLGDQWGLSFSLSSPGQDTTPDQCCDPSS